MTMRSVLAAVSAAAVFIPSVRAEEQKTVYGLREQAARVQTDAFSAAADRSVALNAMQQHIDAAKQAAWKSSNAAATLRVTTYTSAKAAGMIPIVGGMVEDADDKVWQNVQSFYDRTFIDYIQTSLSQAWAKGEPIGGLTREQARQRLLNGDKINAPAATAYVSNLLRDNRGDFQDLPGPIQNQLQNAALGFLARALDDTAALSAATAEEVRRLDAALKKYGHALRGRDEREKARARRADLRAALKQDTSQLATDMQLTPLNNVQRAVQTRTTTSAYFRESANQLDAMSTGFQLVGDDRAAAAASKAAKASRFMQSWLLVLAGDPLSIIPTFTNAISLFGQATTDPSAEVLTSLRQIDAKIDAYHAEVMQQLGAISLMIHELQSAAAFQAAGGTNSCHTWLRNATELRADLVVHEAGSHGSFGTVEYFWPLYSFNARQISEMLRDGQLQSCLTGMLTVFSRSEDLNAAIQLPDENPSNSNQLATPNISLSKQWGLVRAFVNNNFLPESKTTYLSVRDTSSSLTEAIPRMSSASAEMFLRFGRLYNPAAVARLGSYAAGLHHFYAFSKWSENTGKLVVQDALTATELSIEQMQVLFGGPMIEVGAAALTNWPAFLEGRCRQLLTRCDPASGDQMRTAVIDILKQNGVLRYNVGASLISSHARAKNVRAISYGFVLEHANSVGDEATLLALLGNELPGGGKPRWNAEHSEWHWTLKDIDLPFPSPSQLADGTLRFPAAFYELLRIGDQLATELATYEMALEDRKKAIDAAKSVDTSMSK
ncbi:hypothetical protein AWB67_06557 [Caballeronia terrestris]|uniref:Uncharacterized protein n=1 Tax=Caballeronia terrestris TaxID=1226301 RepID=A0A158KTC9_9BURK|nr:hypothetical protein [Caballeronia terrestris]SAL83989.1 hypothetical protein AWB67_06557 [Caballeronia terrestris]